MRRYDVIAEVCDYMLELGWEAYQNDHEDAIGQFEMNWKYDDVLQTADKHSFFKFMMKSVAEKHGLPRHLHAQAVQGADRVGLPRAYLGLVAGRQDQRLRRQVQGTGPVRSGAATSLAGS